MQSLGLLCFEKLKVWELYKLPPEAKERLIKENIQNVCGTTVSDILTKNNFNVSEITDIDVLIKLREERPFFRMIFHKGFSIFQMSVYLGGHIPNFPSIPYMMYYVKDDPDTKFVLDHVGRYNFLLDDILYTALTSLFQE